MEVLSGWFDSLTSLFVDVVDSQKQQEFAKDITDIYFKTLEEALKNDRYSLKSFDGFEVVVYGIKGESWWAHGCHVVVDRHEKCYEYIFSHMSPSGLTLYILEKEMASLGNTVASPGSKKGTYMELASRLTYENIYKKHPLYRSVDPTSPVSIKS